MAYDASSKKINPIKDNKSKASAIILSRTSTDKKKNLEDFKVMEAFISDVSDLLSKSNFEYKKILLDEFYTLLKNYKAVTTSDIETLSSDMVTFTKENILTSLDNILTLIGSESTAIKDVIINAFEEFKNNNIDALNNQFEQLNTQSDALKNSILNAVNSSHDKSTEASSNDETPPAGEADSVETVLKNYNDASKKEFAKNNQVLLNDIQRVVNTSSTRVIQSISSSNKTLLSNTVTNFEKVIEKSKADTAKNDASTAPSENDKTVTSTIKSQQSISEAASSEDNVTKPTQSPNADSIAKQIINQLKRNNLIISPSDEKRSAGKNNKDPNTPILNSILSKVISIEKNIIGAKKQTNTDIKQISEKKKSTKESSTKSTGGGLLASIGKSFSSILGKFAKPFVTILSPIFALIGPIVSFIKVLIGGPIRWIVSFVASCLKSPTVMMAVALAVVFFKNKIVKPLKSFWDKVVKPIFDAMKPVIDFIWNQVKLLFNVVTDFFGMFKKFFGELIEIGFKPALMNMWERLKVAFPIWLKHFMLNSIIFAKDVYYKYILPIINNVKVLFYKHVYNPIVKFWNMHIKDPVLKAWHTIQSKFTYSWNTLMSYIYKILAFVTFGSTSKEFERKQLEAEKAANASDTPYIPVDINDGVVDTEALEKELNENAKSDREYYEKVEKSALKQQAKEDIKAALEVQKAKEKELNRRNAELKLKNQQQSELTAATNKKADVADIIALEAGENADNQNKELMNNINKTNEKLDNMAKTTSEGFKQTGAAINNANASNTNVVNVTYNQRPTTPPSLYSPTHSY